MFAIEILMFLFWPVVIIGGIRGLLQWRRNRHVSNKNTKGLEIFLSPADAMSQMYILFGVVFFGLTLLGLNRELSDPLSWQLIILITSGVALAVAYYFKLIYTLIFGLLGLIIWWPVQLSAWVEGAEVKIKPSAYLLGPTLLVAIYYLLARTHDLRPKYKRFGLVYLMLSLVFVTVTLFVLSSTPGLNILQGFFIGKTIITVWQASVCGALLFFVYLSLFIPSVRKGSLGLPELCFWPIFIALILATNFVPSQELISGGYAYYSSQQPLTAFGYFWTVIINIMLFAELLGLVFIGYSRREMWLINLGSVGLFIFVIIKYFDWFFSFMNKGLFFIGAGLLLFIAGGFMEKKRRSLALDIKQVNPIA